MHRQPVKLTENWSDVFHFQCFCDYMGGCVLNTLEFGDLFIQEAEQEYYFCHIELHVNLFSVIQDTISCAQSCNSLRPDDCSVL